MNAIEGFIQLTATMKREGEYWITTSEALPLAGYGKSREESFENLVKALRAYIEANKKLGQIESVLHRVEWMQAPSSGILEFELTLPV